LFSSWLFCFQKSERLIVATALQVVSEIRIEIRWELGLKGEDSLGDFLELFQMRSGIAISPGMICDDGFSLAQSFGEQGVGAGIFHRVHSSRSGDFVHREMNFLPVPKPSRIRIA